MQLPPLRSGTLLRRYNRFLADVRFDDGEDATVHCPNPGSMAGLKTPGFPVWCSTSDNPKRKLKYTLELVEADKTLVSVNTNNPNRLAEEAIRSGLIGEIGPFDRLRREVKYGRNSRIDIHLETPGGGETFVEVKNVHFRRTGNLAEFPDSVTARGAKHLEELMDMISAGHRAIMLFIVQRSDCNSFQTAPDYDQTYHETLLRAADHGVEVLCYDCDVTLTEILVRNPLPWTRF